MGIATPCTSEALELVEKLCAMHHGTLAVADT